MKTILDYFGIKGIPLLDKRMPKISQGYKTALFADSSLTVQAFTLTFRPSFHKEENKILHKKARDHICAIYCHTMTPFYLDMHSELTTNNVLHYHIVMVGTKHTLSKLTSTWRKSFGFTYPSKIFDLNSWMIYINKENLFLPFEYFIFSKKIKVESNLNVKPNGV